MAQHIDMSNNANDAEVFNYTSVRGERVPCDVVASGSIPPSRQSLITILSTKEVGRGGVEGLVIIGKSSFSGCYHYSITKINFPTSPRRINDWALSGSLRCPIRLHDDIESIGSHTFNDCLFTNFRIPPLNTDVPNYILHIVDPCFLWNYPKT